MNWYPNEHNNMKLSIDKDTFIKCIPTITETYYNSEYGIKYWKFSDDFVIYEWDKKLYLEWNENVKKKKKNDFKKDIIKKVQECETIERELATNLSNLSLTTENVLQENSAIIESLQNTIQGFHLIHKHPLAERNWEEIFVQTYSNISKGIEYECGKHSSGRDCAIDGVSFSNKTAKIKNNKLSISSYRLTRIDRNDIHHMIQEIDITRKNFDYYALLAREEQGDKIVYYYFKIPSDFFKAKNFAWERKFNKLGKSSGWKTNIQNGIRLDITFSMSSQLWIHIDLTTIMKFLVTRISIDLRPTTLNYSTLYKLHKSGVL